MTDKQEGMSLRQSILDHDDRPLKKLEIEEWPFDIYIRPLSGHEMDRLQSKVTDGTDKNAERLENAYIVQLAVVDETGQRIFSTKDIEALKEKSVVACQKITNKVLEINGLTPNGREAAEKN